VSQLSRVLRDGEGGRLMYWCQGCELLHSVQIGQGPGPRWGFNGNFDKPTFEPSVLTQWDEAVPPVNADNLAQWRAAPWPQHKEHRVCHTFIREGMVQFLGDCTHALAGQTVPMAELPEWLRDDWQPKEATIEERANALWERWN
jgi:hypothetical protein